MIKNKNIKVRLSLYLSVLVASGCWDRQDIPVVPAPVPVYTLSGIVTDMDSGEPLPEVVVEVTNISTASAGYEITVYDTTDDLGYYEFTDVISPGFVYFYAWRESHPQGSSSGAIRSRPPGRESPGVGLERRIDAGYLRQLDHHA
jgi:hypothetical protein